ncbi:hypothetical protein IPN41_04410 [Candidatus Falkowbacteria bacterium]|nr:MAG: hypothetical protein IPN41_04410 [Candidatus Falkowbacteria bacterium]
MISRLKQTRYAIGLFALGCLALLVFSSVSADTIQNVTKNDKGIKKEILNDTTLVESEKNSEEVSDLNENKDLSSEFTCGNTITDRDGYTYETVSIGSECWMANNLKTITKGNGELLTNRDDNSQRDCISSTSDERGTEADCQAGRTLYTLEAALDGDTTEGAQGLCPEDWHLPTDSELHNLEMALSNDPLTCDDDRIGSGCADAGTDMLIGGNSGLNIDYTGLRYKDDRYSRFIGHNSLVLLWSSTQTSPTTAYGRYIGDWNPAVVDRGIWGEGTGDNVQSATIRCIKDQSPIHVCGQTLQDRDGYTYSTIQIGDQCWINQNLRTKTYPNGTCINGSAFPCTDASVADNFKNRSCYDNLETNCATDGALYSWYGAMNIAGDWANPGFSKPMPNPYTVWNNHQGICPTGWHIPTPDDFTTLARTACATGTGDCSVFPYGPEAVGTFGTNEGNKLISGTIGFNAKLSGMRTSDFMTSMQKGQIAYLWGAAFNGIISNQAYRISLIQAPYSTGVERKYTYRFRNYPVRCIKNI